MKHIEEYIIRDYSVLNYEKQMEHLYTFKNFPVFFGCVTQPFEDDIFADQEWGIDKTTGIVQLTKLIPLKILYLEQHFDGYGETWAKYYEDLSDYIKQYGGKEFLEIGGGYGHLAKLVLGKVPDSTFTIVEPNPKVIENDRLKVLHGFFDENFTLNFSPDTVIHSQVLEHAYDPIKFLTDIYNSLPIKGRLIFGYPNLEYLFKNKYTNAINFEHTMLLSDYYLDFMVKQIGFEIVDKTNFQNHSHFYCLEKTGEKRSEDIKLENRYDYYKDMFNDYIATHKESTNKINDYIDANPDSKIYLFGAHIFSQSLIAFGLNTKRIECILDNSPNKQNKRMYGTELQVNSPSVLKNSKNSIVILRAGLYNEEIKKDIVNNINQDVIFI